ncbi:MAG: hydrogenase formation protein HypD [Candidatus Cloacimonetes bacterium]|nr:hydrogenase formation protein HypD [Candidatus Cloacimonadota bacterium]
MELNNFRNPELIKKIVTELQDWKKPVKFMEVCGSHTMAIGHWGIRKLLPKSISLISGPGCPVCVTPSSVVDSLIDLKNVTIATFGDLIRVPGNKGTLEQARANGLDVRMVYSPMESLEIAKYKETVLVGIGFETTIPGIAYTILEASRKNLKNLSILPAFKLVPPALDALLSSKDMNVDGFILPGHVSVIIGSDAYKSLPEKFGIGGVVTGFEPLDILIGIKKLIEQIKNNDPKIENEYSRVVTKEGNKQAQEIIYKVMEVENALWRGLGWIPMSGLSIREEFSRFDTIKKYGIEITDTEEQTGCRCGDVLKGKIIPPVCPLFGKACLPNNPIGPCMVSSEGSCAAYYKYER